MYNHACLDTATAWGRVLEVLAGSVIGPLVALPGLALIGTPLHLIQQLSQLLSPSLPAALG